MSLTLADKFNTYFEYKDGCIYWKVHKNNAIKGIGFEAGSKSVSRTYRTVTVDRVSYCTHKVIFCMHNGFMPDMVDHINSNKLDNRIENLRLADKVTNGYNRGVQRNSKSGIKNVSWAKKANKWVVQITKDKKPAYCGYFEDLELAELVATEARSKFHGEYANHGGRLC